MKSFWNTRNIIRSDHLISVNVLAGRKYDQLIACVAFENGFNTVKDCIKAALEKLDENDRTNKDIVFLVVNHTRGMWGQYNYKGEIFKFDLDN